MEAVEGMRGVKFMCKVKGTGPDYEDGYRVVLELCSQGGDVVKVVRWRGQEEMVSCRKDGSVTQVMIDIMFSQEEI